MADAHGSGPCVGNNMRVQVPSPALKKRPIYDMYPESWTH